MHLESVGGGKGSREFTAVMLRGAHHIHMTVAKHACPVYILL